MSYVKLITLYKWLMKRKDVCPGSWTYKAAHKVMQRIKQLEKNIPFKTTSVGNYLGKL